MSMCHIPVPVAASIADTLPASSTTYTTPPNTIVPPLSSPLAV